MDSLLKKNVVKTVVAEEPTCMDCEHCIIFGDNPFCTKKVKFIHTERQRVLNNNKHPFWCPISKPTS